MAYLDEVGLAQVWSLVKAEDNKRATTVTYTATVTTNWTNGGSIYYQDITVNGITINDNPIVDIVLGNDGAANILYAECVSNVVGIQTYDNRIRVLSAEAIASAFPIQLKVVR